MSYPSAQMSCVVVGLAFAMESYSAGSLSAYETPTAELGDEATVNVTRVLASVDSVPIQRGEVRLQLRSIQQSRPDLDLDNPRLVDAALDQIIFRRCALAQLVTLEQAVSLAVVERELDRRRKQFQQQGKSLDEFLSTTGVHPLSYQQRIRWELSWRKYQDSILTEEHLKAFLAKHHREFDGTEIRVRHILLRPKPPTEVQQLEQLSQRAIAIRGRIVQGEINFADAANRYSVAPSGENGGDIGWMTRHGVMHESFAKAAFQLKPGEVSQPVQTPFGVHLIEVIEERPGKREFAEVRPAVAKAAERQLFEHLAENGRQRVMIEHAILP